MDKLEVETKQLPDGRMLFYTTDPGVVLVQPHSRPYGFTGVVNRAWIEAARLVGQQYTPRDINAGWPEAIEPHRLACLQCPQDPTGQTYVNSALIAACEGGVMPHTTFRRIDYMGGNELRREHLDCAIAAKDFAVWLAAQGEEPSVHIAAWLKAVGVTPTAPATDTAQPAPVVASVSSAQAKGRRDVLTPAIETAQKECPDPFDAPAVWAVLVSMAGAGAAPLLGTSDEGIKWLGSNDEAKFLSLKGLRERLNRKKKAR